MISETRIGCDQNLEALTFGYFEQLTVLERRPPAFVSGGHFVLREKFAQRDRRALIEKYAHSGRSERTARRVLEDGAGLLEGDTGEPFDELSQWDAIFEIFKQGGDGYTRTAKHPGAA